MPDDTPSLEETFGTISLCADSTPKHDSDKLDYGGIMASDAMRGDESSEDGGNEGDDGDPNAMRAMSAPLPPDADFEDAAALGDDEAAAKLWRHPAPRHPGGPVKAGSEEAFYLLATYCFDLQRKMEYLYKATRAFARQADPAVARQLLADERRINAPGLTWKQRALRAEARMLELQREIGHEHRRLLHEVANSDRPRDGGGKPSETPIAPPQAP